MKKRYVILGLIGLFLLGLFSGVFLSAHLIRGYLQAVMQGDEKKFEQLVERRMADELDLDSEQRQFAQEWLSQVLAEVRPVHQDAKEEVHAIINDHAPELRRQLSQEQQDELDQWLEKYNVSPKGDAN